MSQIIISLTDSNLDVCGFRGSPFLGVPFENDKVILVF